MHVDPARDGCLAGILPREDHALATCLPGLHSHRQNAPDRPDGAVEGKLTENDVL